MSCVIATLTKEEKTREKQPTPVAITQLINGASIMCVWPSMTLWLLVSRETTASLVVYSEALDNPFCLLGLVVQFSERVEELLHLPLQSGVAAFRSSPSSLRLADPGLDRLVPVALLGKAGFQLDHLRLQLLVSLLQAGRAQRRGCEGLVFAPRSHWQVAEYFEYASSIPRGIFL